jgi:chromosome segregation ATPase
MAEVTMHQTATEEADVMATLEKWSMEIDRLRTEMKETQKEIDRLHEGNLARLANIETVLARIASSN